MKNPARSAHIAGVTIINDISERELHIWDREEERDWDNFFDWLNGKWYDGFAPMGPCVVPVEDIGDPATAARYRASFRYYTEDRLLVSMVFYTVVAALFGGIFIVRYKLELILGAPLLAGFVAAYVRLGLKPESPVQAPERLHLERGFVVFAAVTVIVHVLLMLAEIPLLYELFNVEPSHFEPLWRLGD